jgi:hypothetical protein
MDPDDVDGRRGLLSAGLLGACRGVGLVGLALARVVMMGWQRITIWAEIYSNLGPSSRWGCVYVCVCVCVCACACVYVCV